MEAVAARHAAGREAENLARHDLVAVQHHDPVHGPHELGVAGAPAHAPRDRQLVERRLHDAGQQCGGLSRPRASSCRTGTRPSVPSMRVSAVTATPQDSANAVAARVGLPRGVERGRRPAGRGARSAARAVRRRAGARARRVGAASRRRARRRARDARHRVPRRRRRETLRASASRLFGGSSSVPISTRKSAAFTYATRGLSPFRAAKRGLSPFFMQSVVIDVCLLQHRKAQRLAAGVIRLRNRARERAHAQDVALALGDGDRLARIEQVEDVRGLQRLLVRRQRRVAPRAAPGSSSRAASNSANSEATSANSKLNFDCSTSFWWNTSP